MEISSPENETDALVELWVDLADGQRDHGSHLLAADNEARIRQSIVHREIEDGLRVARVDGDLVGFVMFTLEHSQFEQDVVRGVIENLYVRPRYRSDGLGSALLAAAESSLDDRGADVLAVEAMADNDGARRFYAAAGYEPHRVEYEKPLGTDAAPTGDE